MTTQMGKLKKSYSERQVFVPFIMMQRFDHLNGIAISHHDSYCMMALWSYC